MVKMRKFKLQEGDMVMCPEGDTSGEFFHVNDIKLLLNEKLSSLENQISQYPEGPDQKDHIKEMRFALSLEINIVKQIQDDIR